MAEILSPVRIFGPDIVQHTSGHYTGYQEIRLRDKYSPSRVFHHIHSLIVRKVTPHPSEVANSASTRSSTRHDPVPTSGASSVIAQSGPFNVNTRTPTSQEASIKSVPAVEPTKRRPSITPATLPQPEESFLPDAFKLTDAENGATVTPEVLLPEVHATVQDADPKTQLIVRTTSQDQDRRGAEFTKVTNWLQPVVKAKLDRYREGESTFTVQRVSAEGTIRHAFVPDLIRVRIRGKAAKHADQIEAYLRKDVFKTRLKDFEVEVRQGSDIHYLSARWSYDSTITTTSPEVYISLKDGASSFCGSMLRMGNRWGSSIERNQPVWTCGGLLLVHGRMYALSVAHPVVGSIEPHQALHPSVEYPSMSNGALDDDTSPASELHDGFLAMDWQRMGLVAALSLSGSSTLVNDSDWMLIEIEGIPLLSNTLTLTDGHVLCLTDKEQSGQPEEKEESICSLHTSRGVLQGTLLPGESNLTLGHAVFWVTEITVNQALRAGDSGTWVTQGSSLFGVLIAGSEDKDEKHTGLIVKIGAIFDSLTKGFGGACVRLPTPNEHEILAHQSETDHTDERQLLATLLMRDVINSSGSTATPLLLDLSSGMLSDKAEISSLIALGTMFPLCDAARAAIRHTRALSFRARVLIEWPGAVVPLWEELHKFREGENFIGMLVLLSCLEYTVQDTLKLLEQLMSQTSLRSSGRPSDSIIAALWNIVRKSKVDRWLKDQLDILDIPLDSLRNCREDVGDIAQLLSALSHANAGNMFVVCRGWLCKDFSAIFSILLDTACIQWQDEEDVAKSPVMLTDVVTPQNFPRAYFGPSLGQAASATVVIPLADVYKYLGEVPVLRTQPNLAVDTSTQHYLRWTRASKVDNRASRVNQALFPATNRHGAIPWRTDNDQRGWWNNPIGDYEQEPARSAYSPGNNMTQMPMPVQYSPGNQFGSTVERPRSWR